MSATSSGRVATWPTGRVDARRFLTHHAGLHDMMEADDVVSRTAETDVLKVVVTRS